MTELEQLAADLMAAASVWFSPELHRKLARLIEIAREGERKKREEKS